MDVFLMIRRQKTTVFAEAKETTTVGDLKKIIEGIMKKSPEDMQLLTEKDQVMEDHKSLSDYGYTSSTAKAQAPARVGMVFKVDNGQFEQLEIAPLSTPPELPDVMKPQESSSHAPEQVAM